MTDVLCNSYLVRSSAGAMADGPIGDIRSTTPPTNPVAEDASHRQMPVLLRVHG